MYSTLMMAALIILPIPVMIKDIYKNENQYRTIVNGIICAGIGTVLILIISSAAGKGFAYEIKQSIDAFSGSFGKNAETYRKYLEESMQLLPSAMLFMAAVVSYIEYAMLSRAISLKKEDALRLPPFREFSWPRRGIIGWFIIFLISWMFKAGGTSWGEAAAASVNVLFETAFALQGISLLFMIFFVKKIPKGFAAAAAVILWFLPFGRSALFLAGIADILLGLHVRLSHK